MLINHKYETKNDNNPMKSQILAHLIAVSNTMLNQLLEDHVFLSEDELKLSSFLKTLYWIQSINLEPLQRILT